MSIPNPNHRRIGEGFCEWLVSDRPMQGASMMSSSCHRQRELKAPQKHAPHTPLKMPVVVYEYTRTVS